MAAAHLLSERRRARNEEARELLREQPTILELSIDEEEEAGAVGHPQASPAEKLAAPPAAAIPLGYPRETHAAATQTGPAALPEDPSWEEIVCLLHEAKALDVLAEEVGAEAFAALDRYCAFHPKDDPEVKRWRSKVACKRDELAHLREWRAERAERRRLAARARAEAQLEEARHRRLEKERAIIAAKARWDEARLEEERAAIELGLAHERGNAPPRQRWDRYAAAQSATGLACANPASARG